jgi:hypothetical protein
MLLASAEAGATPALTLSGALALSGAGVEAVALQDSLEDPLKAPFKGPLMGPLGGPIAGAVKAVTLFDAPGNAFATSTG